jgi:crotonobetainyl-CoA:carnitine CoA-transferase CaiB-like acyl-CoA transferase
MFDKGGVAEQLDLMTTTTHPTLEEVPRTRALVTLSRAEETLRPGTLCGEYTDAILTELGYDDDRIADMRSRGVIGS